jgi:hypothetical protein
LVWLMRSGTAFATSRARPAAAQGRIGTYLSMGGFPNLIAPWFWLRVWKQWEGGTERRESVQHSGGRNGCLPYPYDTLVVLLMPLKNIRGSFVLTCLPSWNGGKSFIVLPECSGMKGGRSPTLRIHTTTHPSQCIHEVIRAHRVLIYHWTTRLQGDRAKVLVTILGR